ncbi:MAG: TIGR04013 family B12-binding domain/radical SAM domain-containing protein [Promethearchaeota archaeon]
MKGLVLFGYNKPNRYTWAILLGYLEQDPVLMEYYDLKSLPFQLYQAPDHPDIIRSIPFQDYDVVVIAYSLMSIQLPQFRDFNLHHPQYFSNLHPNVVTVAGGPHVLAKPEDMTNFGVDFVIPNEGERAFQQLLHALRTSSSQKSKLDIDVTILSGVGRVLPNYIPAIEPQLVTLGKYPSFSPKFRLFGPIEISRGCPFRCKFCQTGNSTQRMRHASVENLLKWITLGSELKYDKLWFLTPNAFAYGSRNGVTPNVDALHQLLSGISNIKKIKGIFFGTFPSEVRPESVTSEVLETVTPFLANKKILIGAQTASNRLLRTLARGHTIEDIYAAIDLLGQYGFKCEVDFIFGLPGEQEADIEANIQFFEDVRSNRLKNVKIHTHTFMPLPGTPFENELPGQVSQKLQDIIGKLAKEGKAYGEYQAQAGLVSTRYTKK